MLKVEDRANFQNCKCRLTDLTNGDAEMNERIQILRQTVSRVTQILVGSNIKVTQEGIQPFVKASLVSGKPVLINLPYLPETASDALCNAVQGFLDHEVAHCLFSDFQVLGKAEKMGCKTITNLIEDYRVEKKMGEQFRGSVSNLNETGGFYLDEYVKPKLALALENKDRNTIAGILMVPLIRAMGGQRVFQDFMADKMELVSDVYNLIEDLKSDLNEVNNCDDVVKLANEITTRLKAKDKNEDSNEKENAGDEESESSGNGESENRDGAVKPDDNSGDTRDNEGGVSSPTEGKAEGEEKDGKELKREYLDESSSPWGAIDRENANGTDKDIASVLKRQVTDSVKNSEYSVFTTDYDRTEPLHIGSGYIDSMLAEVESETNHMVAPLQKDLERAITARTRSTWSPGHTSGKIHSANLSRVATGDDRVFRRRYDSTSKDVAVELLIDCSGSMDGRNIRTAVHTAYVLASTLERIGIKTEVLSFTTGVFTGDVFARMQQAEFEVGKYSRTDPIMMPIIKSFNERMTADVKKRFAWLPYSRILRNNVDGESLEVAAYRVMARREEKKIIIVLSDGNPTGGKGPDLRAHLSKTVTDIENRGIVVFGIGINTDVVDRFYRNFVVIRSVDELPTTVMVAMKKMLIN